jgi:hypothetical protein
LEKYNNYQKNEGVWVMSTTLVKFLMENSKSIQYSMTNVLFMQTIRQPAAGYVKEKVSCVKRAVVN